MADPMLSISALTLSFGGIRAIRNVSFSVEPGELFAIIGPNGAGKSSVFNCISGIYRPQSGSILVDGTQLVGCSAKSIAERGVARTFQNLGLFGNLDVHQNLLLGRHLLMERGFLACMVRTRGAGAEEFEHRRHVDRIVERLDLTAFSGRPVSDLPYGVQKRIELGRALAMEPRLLLLDEPAAGLNRRETEELAHYVLTANEDEGITVVLIEHDTRLVMDLADRVLVMNFGEMIALDVPEVVQSDAGVLDAYLGAPSADGWNGSAREVSHG